MQVLYPSSFSQLLAEFEAFARAIQSAKRYFELRKTAKASRLITAIENSENFRQLLAGIPQSSPHSAYLYWTCLTGLYLAAMWTGWRLVTGTVKVQV